MRKLIPTLLLAVAPLAHAEFRDGNDLFSKMRESGTGYNAVTIGYVQGVVDALQNVLFCPPPSVTAGQLYDMVRGYLADNPGERHLSGDVIITRVLKSSWPCPKRGSGT